MRARLATTVGGAAATVSRLAGRDGSVIGGIIGLRLQPDLLSLLAQGRHIVLVTGTNGKTTTTRLITAAIGVHADNSLPRVIAARSGDHRSLQGWR